MDIPFLQYIDIYVYMDIEEIPIFAYFDNKEENTGRMPGTFSFKNLVNNSMSKNF